MFSHEAEWFFYYLWKPTDTLFPFSFSIPNTFVYKTGLSKTPNAWYFTSKLGLVLKKRKHNLKLETIKNFLKKKMTPESPIILSSYSFEPPVKSKATNLKV